MNSKTMGEFLKELRNLHGMTQQQIADRLNVSNKAVSRWERDETTPDISLLPAIAEMYGITCDELLSGQKNDTSFINNKSGTKTEKQLKNMLNRSLSGFKTLVLISVIISAIGITCMFGISYGFYRPVIGFAIMLIFEICSFGAAFLGVKRIKDIKSGNELFESIDEKELEKFENSFSFFAFLSFFIILAVVLYSLPLIIFRSYNIITSVLDWNVYFTFCFTSVSLILICIFLTLRKPFYAWLNGKKIEFIPSEISKPVKMMNRFQIAFSFIAGLIFVYSPYLYFTVNQGDLLPDLFNGAGLALLAANIIYFIVFMCVKKAYRSEAVFLGIRNMLLCIPAILISNAHYVGFTYYEEEATTDEIIRYDSWQEECIFLSLAIVGLLIVIFKIIEYFKKKGVKKNEFQ